MSLRTLIDHWPCLLLLNLAVSAGSAASLTGTLYSQHGGSNNASVTVEIASEGHIYQMHATERLLQGFKPGQCRDIGAIWTVEFTAQQNSRLVMTKAACDGEVDTVVHDAWLLVTNHLRNRAPQLRPTLEAVSIRWRVSEASEDYEERMKEVKFSDYVRLGGKGKCLDVHAADALHIELATTADCHLLLRNSPVNLKFSIVGNRPSKDLEIDEIRFVDR